MQTLTISRGDSATLSIQARLNGLLYSALSSCPSVIFTAKASVNDADEDAVFQKALGAGITIAGAVASVELVPDDTSGLVVATTLVWDVQAQEAGGAVRTVATGTLTIGLDVTQSTGTSVPIYTTQPSNPGGGVVPLPAGYALPGADAVAAVAVQGVTDGIPIHVIVDSGGGGGGGGGSTDGLTDAQLRASAVLVSVSNFPGSQAVTGPLTDSQLRATAVPVSGPLTDTQLRATAIPVSGTVTVSGPLTDTQLRATAVPVSGPITDTQIRATALPVSLSFPATQPVSAAALPLPAGASTETTLASILSKIIAAPATETTVAAILAAQKAEDAPASTGDLGTVLLAVRQDNDGVTVSTDGDYSNLQTNAEGRLKVSTKPGDFALAVGAITANTQTVPVDVSHASNVMIHMVATSLVGHNSTFEGSLDSTTGTDGAWFAIQVIRSNANTIELVTGVLAATPAYAWEASVNGLSFIRVRATAHTSGTATWKFQRGSYATEPIPASQISGTQPVSGTVTATVTGGTVLPVTPTTTFTNSLATTNATVTKASAGSVWSVVVSNINAAARFLKIYNKASAPTVGTDIPVIVIPIPAGAVVQVHGGSNGIRFATGISWALTTGSADTDTAAVAAGEIKVGISFT